MGNKVNRFFKSIIIPLLIPLSISVIILVVALFLGDIQPLLNKRKVQINRDHQIYLAQKTCDTDCEKGFKTCSEVISSCEFLLKLSRSTNAMKEIIKLEERLCELNDPTGCFDYAKSLFKLGDFKKYRLALKRSCRGGKGGNREACKKLKGD